MRFWPFGRKSEGVEFVTRVVTAVSAGGAPVRARMTLHFVEAMEEEAAGQLADRATSLLEVQLRRAHDPEAARGEESSLGRLVREALETGGVTGLRKLEVAGVHAVRLVTPSARPPPSAPPEPEGATRPSGRPPSFAPPPDAAIPFAPPLPRALASVAADTAPTPSGSAPGGAAPAEAFQRKGTPPGGFEAPTRVSYGSSVPPSHEVIFSPPPSRVSPSVAPAAPLPGPPELRQTPSVPPPMLLPPPVPLEANAPMELPLLDVDTKPGPPGRPRTRTSARFRAVTNAIFVPRGASREEIAEAVRPVISDAAARILVGALRFYDLLAIRGVSMSDVTEEMLAAVAPVSDAPCGQYEQSRAGELDRWRHTLGDQAVAELHHESRLLSMLLLHEALVAVRVAKPAALSILEALAATLEKKCSGVPDLAKYLHPIEPSVAAQFVAAMAAIVGMREAPEGMARAVGTVVAKAHEEIRVAAMVVELSQRA